MRVPSLLPLIVVVVGLNAAAVAAQDSPLSAAHLAYRQAEFAEALAIVDDLLARGPAPGEHAEVLELRATLLFALRADGWRDTLRELAHLSPSHDMPPDLPPQLSLAWHLARAAALAPCETALARARARFVVADFEGALAALAELPGSLTLEQQVERLVLEALARFGLRDISGTEQILRRLARVAPARSFGPQVPPSFREAWHRARATSTES